jgi:hypothetical protein
MSTAPDRAAGEAFLLAWLDRLKARDWLAQDVADGRLRRARRRYAHLWHKETAALRGRGRGTNGVLT